METTQRHFYFGGESHLLVGEELHWALSHTS